MSSHTYMLTIISYMPVAAGLRKSARLVIVCLTARLTSHDGVHHDAYILTPTRLKQFCLGRGLLSRSWGQINRRSRSAPVQFSHPLLYETWALSWCWAVNEAAHQQDDGHVLLPSSSPTTYSSTCWQWSDSSAGVSCHHIQAWLLQLSACVYTWIHNSTTTARSECSCTTHFRPSNIWSHHAQSDPAALAAHSLADTV